MNHEKIIKYSNKVIDIILNVIGIILLLLSLYSLIDIYTIYNRADITSQLNFMPKVSTDKITFKDTPDAIAWLEVPNTTISYPIMQGKDNNEYLNKNYKGEFSLSGSIFLDFRNDKYFNDKYSVLYGHHMENYKMFGALDKYFKNDVVNKKYLKKHNTGFIITRKGIYKLDILYAFEDENYNDYIFSPNESYNNLEYIKNKIGSNDDNFTNIVTLTTCKTPNSSKRKIVVAKTSKISNKEYKQLKKALSPR